MSEIKIDRRNYRKHNDRNKSLINKSLSECGAGRSILIDNENSIVAGNGIYEQSQKLGIPIRVIETDGTELIAVKRTDLATDDDKRKQLAIMDNSTSDSSEFDFDLLQEDFSTDEIVDFGIDEIEKYLDSQEAANKWGTNNPGALSEKFLIPPFDIWDARRGEWQDRKRIWNSKIGDDGSARGTANVYGDSSLGKFCKSHVSILDPVLSEIVNLWFTPDLENIKTFDCFAGDTVFGFVSAYLGNHFTGIELRQEQADFNNSKVCGMTAEYICDDGRNIDKYLQKESQDLFFSCPPYFDLEIYSDLPNDASNQNSYEDFLSILDEAFSKAIECLKQNRFAVVVVGDVRNKKNGGYYNFPNDIINIFRKNGLLLYNNIKLLTPIGSAPYKAAPMMKNRKTVHVYQDVLIFYKGDTAKIKEIFREIDISELEKEDESTDF